jgi:hypothetical protein
MEYIDLKERMLLDTYDVERQFGELNALLPEIVGEYKRVVMLRLGDDQEKKITEDIHRLLSVIVDGQGKISVNIEGLRRARQDNFVITFLSSYTAPFDSFVTGRIYGTMMQMLDAGFEKWFETNFSEKSAKQAGIFTPHITGKREMPLSVPPTKDDE